MLAAAGTDEGCRQAESALTELCQTYWAPLYTFTRGRGYKTHDAQDLTQGFFAHLIEHRIYEQTDPAKGKFRSYLLAALKNFLASARARDQALKRGGSQAPLPLREETVREAENFYQARHFARHGTSGFDRLFELSWAQALVAAALQRISRTYGVEGKKTIFAALRPFIAGEVAALCTYDKIAASLGMPVSTVRSHVTRLRASYRQALHAEVRRTVNSDAEVKEELSAFLRVLAGG